MVSSGPNRVLQVPKVTLRQTLPRFLHLAALVLVLTVLPALAKTHPVPLDKNVDAAKCLECHDDKAKGKSVHSAIATGCTSCHEVRVGKDVTRVKLTTTTVVKLCIQCHSDKDASQIKGTVHSPAVRDCIKCHDPHVSENKNQLLEPLSGASAKENLCLRCHAIGLNTAKDGSRHAALDMGCDACHVMHKVGDPNQREFRQHLTKNAPALCLDCHDAKDANLVKAHQGQPFEKADCVNCHDPHQSKSPKLMQAFLHSPFESKSCDTCHQPAKDGKVVLTAASPKEVCVTCHADKEEQIDRAKVPHPGAAGDCTDCHSPHAGKSPGFPKPDAVSVCLGCHSDQAAQHSKKYLHQPAFEQGCATCHEPHGGDNPKLLRAAKINQLCLECHGPDPSPQRLESEHLITIFDGKVKLPENYFGKVILLPLKYGRGHPLEGHPVSDVMDPQDVTKVAKPLNCLSCHQPHASAQPGLLVNDQVNNTAFCMPCHKDFATRGK
jgi:predicted CXXCH cytochrome family protein